MQLSRDPIGRRNKNNGNFSKIPHEKSTLNSEDKSKLETAENSFNENLPTLNIINTDSIILQPEPIRHNTFIQVRI